MYKLKLLVVLEKQTETLLEYAIHVYRLTVMVLSDIVSVPQVLGVSMLNNIQDMK